MMVVFRILIISEELKDRYKTEISQKSLIEMSADRGPLSTNHKVLTYSFQHLQVN
jgi:hypothetical protein